jgi:hypothetical protein
MGIEEQLVKPEGRRGDFVAQCFAFVRSPAFNFQPQQILD